MIAQRQPRHGVRRGGGPSVAAVVCCRRKAQIPSHRVSGDAGLVRDGGDTSERGLGHDAGGERLHLTDRAEQHRQAADGVARVGADHPSATRPAPATAPRNRFASGRAACGETSRRRPPRRPAAPAPPSHAAVPGPSSAPIRPATARRRRNCRPVCRGEFDQARGVVVGHRDRLLGYTCSPASSAGARHRRGPAGT